jgi:hypothetical protein
MVRKIGRGHHDRALSLCTKKMDRFSVSIGA